jgi:exodeoxyribonuclease V gamma subunit
MQLVTQTEGMNNWLKQALASHLGIAANCSFNKPNDLVSQIYYCLGGQNKPLLSVDVVKWRVFQLLGETDFAKRYPLIANYYVGHDVKQIALASKVADLFDQYQMYRPDTISAWNKSTVEESADNWQQYLWVRIQSLVKHSMLDKTGMIQFIIEALKQPSKQQILQAKLPRIHFFGIAVITPFYVQLFHEWAKYIDIRFYLLNPAPTSYWLEDKSEKEIARIMHKGKQPPVSGQYSTVGNSLLQNWGSIIKDSFSILFEDDTFINQYNDDLALEPPAPTSLLKKIQHDIYFNEPADSRNRIETNLLKDGTLTINACFTSVREVEVLYNYLVKLVDEKTDGMSARDIVVMVSDIDHYAPYIRAIFDNAPYYFPYTIADESIVSGNNLFQAIESILQLSTDRFKAEEVLELLESPYIRERFGLKDLPTIRKRVSEANIRFGLYGDAGNETRIMSWEYGLQRLMYGICMSGEPTIQVGNDLLIPMDNSEGAETQELVRFWHFIQILEYTVRQREAPRSINNWVEYLQQLIDNMVFQSGDTEDEDYHQLVTYLEKLTLLDSIGESEIGFDVFRHSFLDILHADTRSQAFSGSGITFCSLIPMRSIPFKVVCMLGMDFDKFPRKETKLSFNLLEKQKRKGDRSVKDNDKHLFLETLLSAKEHFYLSYIGRSAKDGDQIPPSSLVDELISYILDGTNAEEKIGAQHLITTHPLQGFSQQYFNGSGLVSYLSDDKYLTDEDIPFAEKEPLQISFDEILVKDLLQFFKDPIKWYFNKALGIYYRSEEMLLPDVELFKMDSLGTWKLKKDLLELPDTEFESYFGRQKILGNLPLKNMGRLYFDENVVDIIKKRNRLNNITGGLLPESVLINIPIENGFITGKLHNIYGDKMVASTFSKVYYKHVVEAFISYLLATAQGKKLDFYFIHFSMEKDFMVPMGSFTQQEAMNLILELVIHFKEGFVKPFLFCPSFTVNPFDLFEHEAASFVASVEKMRWNNFERTFEDDYLKKAYEHHYFCEENFEEMKTNSLFIFETIESAMPGIIKK